MTLKTRQDFTYRGNDQWDWAVWLEGPAEELNAVRRVTYTLHASFLDPVREISTRRNGFRLDSSGWGEFDIYIAITQKDGKIRHRKHALKLAYPEQAAVEVKVRGAKTAAAPLPGRMFVSGGLADGEAVEQLDEGLRRRGVEVVRTEKPKSGALKNADMAAFLISGRPNLWMTREMEMCQTNGLPFLPILVGSAAELPDSIKGVRAIRVSGEEGIEGVAEQVAQWSSTQVFGK